MWKALPLVMLLLSGCATTVSSAKAICEIEKPTITENEARSLSDRSLFSLDRFFAEFDAGCSSL